MICGAHESIAGGLWNALDRASADGCRAVQIFSKNSSQWREPPLDENAQTRFRARLAEFGGPVMAHTSYLINIAADKADIRARSIEALVAEVLRCDRLGVAFAVLHPGAHLGAGESAGIGRAVAALDEVHERTASVTTKILLENTAGQGSSIGHRFEHLGEILSGVKAAGRLGVCFDTQHAFAAGYDLSAEPGYDATWRAFESAVGLECLAAFHLNDSKKGLGSRVDRHDHLGEGAMGLSPFWRLVNDPRFRTIPGVLETEPREGPFPYRDEVALLNSLVGAPIPPPSFRLTPAPSESLDPKKARPRRPTA